MKITSAEFIKSAFDRSHWVTGGESEIAFLGRSNVGKSSLLNSLLLRKGLARTSNTPGRTQSINFFLINGGTSVAEARESERNPKGIAPESGKGGFYFVDLPGYGYARVSKTMRADWGTMAADYLADRKQLVLCIQLIDSRHKPTELDIQLNEWLEFHQKPHLIVATKADKISRNDLKKSIQTAAKLLPGPDILAYSAIDRRGRDEMWGEINRSLKKN
ncbi:MAG: GTP-binding protein [Pyrinomonadaceae bacterium]